MTDESAAAAKVRSQLVELATAEWLDGFDREFIRNVLIEEPRFDYLTAITNRRIEKILKEAEFRRRHPNATTWAW